MRLHHLFAITSALMLPSSAWSMDCRRMIETHGFKAEAQVTCGFGQPENEGLALARQCARRQDPSLNVAEIQRGGAVFQATVRRMGKAAACADVYRTFDGVFARE